MAEVGIDGGGGTVSTLEGVKDSEIILGISTGGLLEQRRGRH